MRAHCGRCNIITSLRMWLKSALQLWNPYQTKTHSISFWSCVIPLKKVKYFFGAFLFALPIKKKTTTTLKLLSQSIATLSSTVSGDASSLSLQGPLKCWHEACRWAPLLNYFWSTARRLLCWKLVSLFSPAADVLHKYLSFHQLLDPCVPSHSPTLCLPQGREACVRAHIAVQQLIVCNMCAAESCLQTYVVRAAPVGDGAASLR